MYSGVFEVVNPLSDFHNSKWQIEDGSRQSKQMHDDNGRISTQVFLRSLIMNMISDFHNLR